MELFRLPFPNPAVLNWSSHRTVQLGELSGRDVVGMVVVAINLISWLETAVCSCYLSVGYYPRKHAVSIACCRLFLQPRQCFLCNPNGALRNPWVIINRCPGAKHSGIKPNRWGCNLFLPASLATFSACDFVLTPLRSLWMYEKVPSTASSRSVQ